MPGHLSVEIVNVGGWGDMALDSSAQFLAVAEDRLIPAKARSISHQLREARLQSVWAPACQDQIPRGHAGVGVIILHGALLSAPTLVTPEFRGWSGPCGLLLPLVLVVWCICSLCTGISERRRILKGFHLLMSC